MKLDGDLCDSGGQIRYSVGGVCGVKRVGLWHILATQASGFYHRLEGPSYPLDRTDGSPSIDQRDP